MDREDAPRPDQALSPRHRKLAELLAQGKSNAQIKELLGYSDSRLSILKHSDPIKEEVRRIMDSVLELDVKARIRRLANPALDVLEEAIRDRTNRFSPKERIEVAKYLADHAAGKAVQKHEVSGGVLLGVMDKLDSMRNSAKGLHEAKSWIDVTPEPPKLDEMTPEQKEEYELVKKWKDGF